MAVQIDFDTPTYLRVGHGMAVVSQRLDPLLPCDTHHQERKEKEEKVERVVINRVFNPMRLAQPEPEKKQEDEVIQSHEEPSTPEAQHAETPPADVIDDATELSFRGKQGCPVNGVFLGAGHAPYRFNKSNSKSFYLRIDSHLIWGVELKSALKKSGAEKGNRISVTFLGKTPIKVLKSVKNGNQTEDIWETRHRNQWDIKVL